MTQALCRFTLFYGYPNLKRFSNCLCQIHISLHKYRFAPKIIFTLITMVTWSMKHIWQCPQQDIEDIRARASLAVHRRILLHILLGSAKPPLFPRKGCLIQIRSSSPTQGQRLSGSLGYCPGGMCELGSAQVVILQGHFSRYHSCPGWLSHPSRRSVIWQCRPKVDCKWSLISDASLKWMTTHHYGINSIVSFVTSRECL